MTERASSPRAVTTNTRAASSWSVVIGVLLLCTSVPAHAQSWSCPYPGTAECGSCLDVGLTATRTHDPAGSSFDERCICRTIEFPIPAEIPVTIGNAGNQFALFTYRDPGENALVTCTYQGGADIQSPTTPDQVALGLSYQFRSCDNGLLEGQFADADYLKLEVLGGDPNAGPTEARLVVEERLWPAEITVTGVL
jgi:hypothetical protein